MEMHILSQGRVTSPRLCRHFQFWREKIANETCIEWNTFFTWWTFPSKFPKILDKCKAPWSQNLTKKWLLCDLFRNMTHVAVNFTVRFVGVGYQAIEPLERTLVTEGMLGNRPIKFVAIEANDGQWYFFYGQHCCFNTTAACRWIYLVSNILWPPTELTAAGIAQRDKRRSVKFKFRRDQHLEPKHCS